MTVKEGQLGMELFAEESIQDPYPLYKRMLDTGPVHAIADSGFFAVCGRDAINDVISRHDVFSSNLTATMTLDADGSVKPFEMEGLGGETHALATADDPIHAAHRKLLLPQLAARRVRQLETFVEATAQRLWDEYASSGRVEWMSAVANRLPMMIVGRLIGVPDDDIEQLMRWGYSSTQLLEGIVSPTQLEAAGVAVMELSNYINDRFVDAAEHNRDTLLGDLATACAKGEVGDIPARVIMITLFSAGGESTASLIGSAAYILATKPDVQSALRADPDLVGAFIEEVLRYEPPFRGHYRHVLEDTALAGVELPAHSRLLLLWGAANRDPSHFAEPNEFQLDRNTKTHLSFGKGAHFCVGASLARMEAKVVLTTLLDRSSWISAAEVGRWLPSLLVRRLDRLDLRITPNAYA
ncbi:MAG: cytochrome P450 [Actinomycetota bacterium]